MMKLCWDFLNSIHLTKAGDFRKGSTYYLYRDKCKNCGDPFLTLKQHPGEFCSNLCAQSGEHNHRFNKHPSKETRRKMSIKSLGKKCNFWKGGVTKKNVALFDTYANQIFFAEEVRRDLTNSYLLQVRCTKCRKWFTPTMKAVNCRISSLNGGPGECRFYCSDICKEKCSIFKCKKWPRGFSIKNDYTVSELSIWRKEVLRRANCLCEYCGEKANTAHHIRPKKLEPFFALDPDYGIACCKKCHIKYGHRDECSIGAIASVICK